MFKEWLIIKLGGRRMSTSHWDEGSDSDYVTSLNLDNRLVGHRKSLPGNGPSYHAMGVRGRLRFDRSLPRRDYVSLRAQGLSGEAVKGNPPTVIARVDESNSSPRTTEYLAEPAGHV